MSTERIEHIILTTYIVGLFITPMVIWAVWFIKNALENNTPNIGDLWDELTDEDGIPSLLTFLTTLLWPLAAAVIIGIGFLWLMSMAGFAIAMGIRNAIVNVRRKHDGNDAGRAEKA